MRRDFQRFPEISVISDIIRAISRQVYEISVSDGPLVVKFIQVRVGSLRRA